MTAAADFLNVEARVEPERDRWSRYLIPHPETGKKVAWTRATTWANSVADMFGIHRWKQRMGAVGLARRPDLLAGVASVADPESKDGKKALDGFIDAAMEHAGSSTRATLGSALHSFAESVDLGRDVQIPAPYDADIAAYRAAMDAAGITIDRRHVERIVCVPELLVAGTFDRLVRFDRPPPSDLLVGDLKTGRDLAYAWPEIAVQLALYAHASTMFDPVTGEHEPMPDVSQERALVMHLPIGAAVCTLYEVDIAAGWEMAQTCGVVRQWRKRKNLATVALTKSATSAALLPAAEVAPSPAPEGSPSTVTATSGAGSVVGIRLASTEQRTAWMRDRIKALGADGVKRLAPRWPAGVPAPKHLTDTGWSDEQVDALATVVTDVEAAIGAPFPESDPGAVRPRSTVLDPDPLPERAPPLVELDDGIPAEPELLEYLSEYIVQLSREAQVLFASWSDDAPRQHRPWARGVKTVHMRHALVTQAAMRCAHHLYDDDEPDAMTRAALAMVLGEELQPTWLTGAVLGSLTIEQAQQLTKVAEAFAASDMTVVAEIGARVGATPPPT